MTAEDVQFESATIVRDLLAKHAVQIRRLIGRRSGSVVLSKTTVDDLFQETCLAAVASAKTFKFTTEASFVAWTMTIARRVISQVVRDPKNKRFTLRIRRPESTGIGITEANLPQKGHTPSSVVAGGESRAAINVALAGLPEHYRQVLSLYRIEQRPLEEVARRMSRTKGATCRLLARAMVKLRESLGE